MTGAAPIAVVGLGGLFPQAPDLDTFQRHIQTRHDASRVAPPGRWVLDPEEAYHPDLAPDTVYSTRACFVENFAFDATGLNLDAETLRGLDPLYEMVLHVGRQAFADAATESLEAWGQTLERIEDSAKPVIAAINGAAIGAGLDLALMCDVRIGSARAKFGSTFASVGLIPGDGGAFLLTRAVGFSRAVELILTARVFDAEEALSMGLLHARVEPDQVLAIAKERAEQIAALPAPAVQMAKVALYRTYTHDAESALQLTAALQSLVQHTKEHSDAVEAMLAKITGK